MAGCEPALPNKNGPSRSLTTGWGQPNRLIHQEE